MATSKCSSLSSTTRSTANFTRKQGEILRSTIELKDSQDCVIKLADVGSPSPVNLAFFAGTAVRTLTGVAGATAGTVAKVPFSFKLRDAETRTTGRGANTVTETAYYQVEMYIPSDNDEVSTGTPLDLDAPNSTLEMEPGDWVFEIRWSEEANPSADDTVRCIIQGTITIEEEIVDLGTEPGTFVFSGPTAP